MIRALARGLDRVAAPVLISAVLVVPFLLVPTDFPDGNRVLGEAFVVTCAWALAVVTGVARALQMRTPLGGGAYSWCRWTLVALFAWILVRNTLAPEIQGAWSYVQTAVGFLLFGQVALDFLETNKHGRLIVFRVLAFGLAFQLVIALLQGLGTNVSGFLSNLPSESLLLGFFNGVGLTGLIPVVPYGSFGNVNYFAEWLALVIPVLIGASLVGKARPLGLALAGLGLVAMLSTSCRAAVLGTGVGAIFAASLVYGKAILDPRRWWADTRTRKYLVIGAVVLTLAIGFLGQKLVQKTMTTDQAHGFQVGDWAPRVVSSTVTLDLWRKQPIVGNGLGFFALRYEDQLPKSFPDVPAAMLGTRFAETHNEPLQGLMELGVIGFVLGIVALALWFRETWTNGSLPDEIKFGLTWGVGALFVCSLLGFPLHIPMTAATLMVVIAMGIARPQEQAAVEQLHPWRIAYALVVGFVFAVTGSLVVTRVERANIVGGYVQGLGELSTYRGDPSTGADLFAVASRFQRYRIDLIYHWMMALQKTGRYEESLALYDAHKDDGLGAAARLLRGLALEKIGRRDEARATLEVVIKSYQPGQNNYKVAAQALDRLQGRP